MEHCDTQTESFEEGATHFQVEDAEEIIDSVYDVSSDSEMVSSDDDGMDERKPNKRGRLNSSEELDIKAGVVKLEPELENKPEQTRAQVISVEDFAKPSTDPDAKRIKMEHTIAKRKYSPSTLEARSRMKFEEVDDRALLTQQPSRSGIVSIPSNAPLPDYQTIKPTIRDGVKKEHLEESSGPVVKKEEKDYFDTDVKSSQKKIREKKRKRNE